MFSHTRKLASWFLPVATFEPRHGGRYLIPSDNGGLDGTLTEFDPPHVINFDGKMRFSLAESTPGACTLTFTIDRGDTGWIPSTLASFQTMLDNLALLLTGQPALERAAYMQAWRGYYPVCEQALSTALANGAKIVHRLHFPLGEDKPAGDSQGQAETFRLSQRRAEIVKKHLVASGIAPTRITTRAFGNYYRLHPGRDEESTRLNRRVELIPLY